MGIKNFTKFIKDKFPDALTKTHISQFAMKKIGIESHLFLFKFKCASYQSYYKKSSGSSSSSSSSDWKIQMMYFLLSFRKHNVHPVIVFEGKNKPNAKSKTVQLRIDNREKVKNRIKLLYTIKDLLVESEPVPKDMIEELETLGQNIAMFPNLTKTKSDLKINDQTKREALLDKHPAIAPIDEEIMKLGKRTVYISDNDINTLKQICDGLGIPYVTAPCEAEAYLCRLLDAKKIDVVCTQDSDVFAYGVSNAIIKYNLPNEDGISGVGWCLTTNVEELCEKMLITREQFLDLCVMCGTDYCENPKNLGCVKLLKLIQSNNYKHLWTEEYECAKNIFLTQGLRDTYEDFEWCSIPSITRIQQLLKTIKCKDSPENIRKMMIRKVVFVK